MYLENNMPFFNKSEIEEIVSIAFEAGEIAAKSQKSGDFSVIKKPDGSSVTSADIEVSQFINQKLSQKFPKIPLVCEEGNLREVGDIFWLIDPIDGTSSFIKGSSEFAVNIALVENKKVVFGLIYAPLFEGGKMAFCDEKDQVVIQKLWQNKLQEREVLKPTESSKEKIRIITSCRTKQEQLDNYIEQFHLESKSNCVIERLSSAVKFFRILENKADIYFHPRQSMEWDSAAGQVLVEFIGGKVKNLFSNEGIYKIGEEVSYKKTNFTNQPFIGISKNYG